MSKSLHFYRVTSIHFTFQGPRSGLNPHAVQSWKLIIWHKLHKMSSVLYQPSKCQVARPQLTKTSISILRFPETNLPTLSTKTYATDSMASMEALDILNTKCGVLQENIIALSFICQTPMTLKILIFSPSIKFMKLCYKFEDKIHINIKYEFRNVTFILKLNSSGLLEWQDELKYVLRCVVRAPVTDAGVLYL